MLVVLAGDKTPGQVAKAYGVHPNSVGLCKRRFVERAPEIFADETIAQRSGVQLLGVTSRRPCRPRYQRWTCVAHLPLPPGVDLEALFAETETRLVARDFTIRFKNRYWQIPEREAADLGPGAEVVVESRLNGGLLFRLGNRYLVVEPWAGPSLQRPPRSPPLQSRRSHTRSRRNPD